jgi:hypothetical protein
VGLRKNEADWISLNARTWQPRGVCIDKSIISSACREANKLKEERACVSLLSLLGNGWVHMLPQQGIVGRAIFYATRLISKEGRRFVLPRTSCYCFTTLLVLRLYRNVSDRIINEYGALGGMKIGRGNQSTRTKLVSVPLCPPQIAHDLTQHRILTTAVGSRQLIAMCFSKSNRNHRYVTTDRQSTSLSWCQVPTWNPRPDFCYCETVAGYLMWGSSLTKGRVCRLQLLLVLASVVILVVWVPRNSWPYFTVSDSRLPLPGGPGSRN